MRAGLILLSLFFLFYSSFAQIKHVNILVGKSDLIVREYLNYLNGLKKNQAYKIKEDIDLEGNLILKSSFSIDDASYYGCQGIMFKFFRLDGEEICISQIVYGERANALSNLNYIKDNFKFVSLNRWERPLKEIDGYKIIATLKVEDGDMPSFLIEYTFSEIK